MFENASDHAISVTELVRLAERHAVNGNDGPLCASLVNDPQQTQLPGLLVVRKTCPGRVEASTYDPVLGLVLRGSAEIAAGNQHVSLAPADILLVSHELAVSSRTPTASGSAPYLAVFMSIDLSIVRSLADQLGALTFNNRVGRSLEVGTPDAALIDALARYLALSPKTVEADVLAPIIRREIHFRLLIAPCGGMLRNLLSPGGHASRISKAIKMIRADFRSPLSIEALSKAVGMGKSSFHAQFKEIAGTTPHQFQKDLRMIEARRILSGGAYSVTSVALAVGYESVSQFSREYSKKFSVSPRHDINSGQDLDVRP